MVQPVSAILTFDLGFRFYSRQSIIYGSTRPQSFSLFVPAHYASSTSSSVHPFTSFVASTSSLDCSGFLWPSIPSRLGFLAASPIAGSIRGQYWHRTEHLIGP